MRNNIEFLEEKRARWTQILNLQSLPIEFRVCVQEKLREINEAIQGLIASKKNRLQELAEKRDRYSYIFWSCLWTIDQGEGIKRAIENVEKEIEEALIDDIARRGFFDTADLMGGDSK